ncbi:MAG: Gfo/Idh/MocA family oxidoreductase [Nitriliruptoraceae bacterium]
MTAATRPLRVAVVGTGFFSGFHLDAWSRVPDARIVAAAAQSDRSRAEAKAAEYDVDEVYLDLDEMVEQAQPDVIDIVTPPTTHLPIIRQLAPHGVPLVVQKPLAPNLDESIAVVEAAERHDTLLVMHENWRFRPWYREIKRLVTAGAIGEPEMIRFTCRPGDGRGPDAYLDRQPRFREMERGLVHEIGIHLIDIFRFLVGDVDRVLANLWRQNPVIAGEDCAYVLFDFVGGEHGFFDGSRPNEHDAENLRLTIGDFLLEGSEGYIRHDGYGRMWIKPVKKPEDEHEYAFTTLGFGGDSVRLLNQHVADHLLDGAPIENTGRQFLANCYVEDAIYRSHDAQAWIPLADYH